MWMKAGLLPGRPCEDDVHHSTDAVVENAPSERSRRRLADIYIPRAIGGKRCALDFACTSGLRADVARKAIENPDETTEALCQRQGLKFIPMVIEAHGGGWSRTARQALDKIARHVQATRNTEAEAASRASPSAYQQPLTGKMRGRS